MRAAAPTHANAMKAVLTDERFSDPDWIFERKLDGIRCVAIRDGARVRLLSRNDLSLNERYPDLARALEAERRTASRSTASWSRFAAARRASPLWPARAEAARRSSSTSSTSSGSTARTCARFRCASASACCATR